MRPNKTEIVLIVDRSGSMASIKKDIEGGFKTFLEKQKALPGEANVTYYQFDDKHERVFELKPLSEVEGITIVPRGSTALLDATGRAINEVGGRLARTSEDERPENVIVVVLTDGEENASREFKIEKIKEMVKHQQEKYNWRFIFLGANFDAISAGASYGFTGGTTMSFATDSKSILCAVSSASDATSHYRSLGTKGVDYSFSESERQNALGKAHGTGGKSNVTVKTTVGVS